MLGIAGGILIAVLVLFLLPILLPVGAFLLFWGVVIALAVAVLIIIASTSPDVLGLIILAFVAVGAVSMWSAWQQRSPPQDSQQQIPKMGTRAYLDWANREGFYADEAAERSFEPGSSDETEEYLLWANRIGRYADASVPRPSRKPAAGPLATFVRRRTRR